MIRLTLILGLLAAGATPARAQLAPLPCTSSTAAYGCQQMDHLILLNSGSSGPADGFTVGGVSLSTIAGNVNANSAALAAKAPLTGADASTFLAPGVTGTIPRSMSARFADVVNVKDFPSTPGGAPCTTNWAPCFNAAIAYIKATPLITASLYGGLTLYVPPGLYPITSTINMTGVRLQRVNVLMHGAMIDAFTAGTPAIDALNSRFLSIYGLHIHGEATAPPNIGIQLGLTQLGNSSDVIYAPDMQIDGTFHAGVAGQFGGGLYVRNTETSTYSNARVWNDSTSISDQVVAIDCLNHWNVQSAFLSVTLPTDTDQSCNEISFPQADFRSIGGPVLYVADSARLKIGPGAYIATPYSNAVTLLFGPNGVFQPSLDVHFEQVGLQNDIVIDALPALAGTVNLVGMDFQDHSSFASNAIIATTSRVTNLILTNVSVNIGSMFSGAHFLDPATALPVNTATTGMFRIPNAAAWNVSDAVMHGCYGYAAFQQCDNQVLNTPTITNAVSISTGILTSGSSNISSRVGINGLATNATVSLQSGVGVQVAFCVGSTTGVTMNLPASPLAGDIVRVTAGTGCSLTFTLASSKAIAGAPTTLTPSTPFAMIYDTGSGWLRLQ